MFYDFFRNSIFHGMAVSFKRFQVFKYHTKKGPLVL